MLKGNELINRRDFFGTVFNDICKLTMTAVRTTAPKKKLIRPPGAIEEIAFLAGCQRCGKCSLVCEDKSIHIAGPDEGVLVGTPYLVPDEQPCTFCLRCIEVCPSGVLENRESIQSYAIGVAKINQDLCLAYHEQLCSSCLYTCPTGIKAIELRDFRYPLIRTEYCIGCGRCIKACIAEGSAITVIPC
ncbi:periplasmic nitrate reductase maturation protein NapF [Desulfitobacterium dehalogenans ATCC 51507]|uniref:Ferredoxin n=1 Tax=Desulfitobacterium dehalogenans (strain ATCC 51507 / DSM 9161 / JW/IU-DC1) TaxID=756499 RepID=I4A6R4_DESDJ|nr:4Fe-4S dicluster domain-containing protein [Desulfitobacterium dehalogenans]AFL99648.1 periplasmic nitrate reductase maturation protein NapF [Desulfitobacterium dehalogenans ATCC 51507]